MSKIAILFVASLLSLQTYAGTNNQKAKAIFCGDSLEVLLKGSSGELREVVREFLEIAKINRPTFKEEGLRQLLIRKANAQGLPSAVDDAGNLVILVPGTGRFAGKALPPLALQSHMDMVQKTAKAMSSEETNAFFANGVPGLELYNGWIRSAGLLSTIGADDGIGVAIMIRYINNLNIEHPPLTLIFTVSEEKGLIGASQFKFPENIGALINLDEERFGKLANGCLGSCRMRISQELDPVPVPVTYKLVDVTIDGFSGGHSGVEIHRNFQNSVKIGAEYLSELLKNVPEVLIVEIRSGDSDRYNDIPNSFSAKIAVPNDKLANAKWVSSHFQAIKRSRFQNKDGQRMRATLTELSRAPGGIFAASPTAIQELLKTLNNIKVGILIKHPGYTHDMDLSSNLAFLQLTTTDTNGFTAVYGIMPRAFQQDSLDDFVQAQSQAIYRSSLNTQIEYPAKSPAWVPKPTWLIDVFNTVAKNQGSNPFEVWSAPGGLETARFFGQKPNVPMIAVGPTIKGAHSEKERVKLATIAALIKILDRVIVEVGTAPEFQTRHQ